MTVHKLTSTTMVVRIGGNARAILCLLSVFLFCACLGRAQDRPSGTAQISELGRENLSRAAAGAAVKKAKELLQEGYLDVRISTPRGRVLLSDEFDQLEG